MAEPEPIDVAAAVYVSIGMYLRRLRQTPVRGDLTLPEMTALSRLERGGSTTPGEMAKVEQISPQAMGVTLGALEARGFVKRESDPNDGRRVVMSLTEAGRAFVLDKRTVRTEQLARVLSEHFSPAERELLLAVAPLIERLGANI